VTRQQLIDAVKSHARDNYEEGGWDYLVECYEDSEIDELIGGATTIAGAIKKVAKVMGIKDDYRKDIEGTIF